MNVAPLRHLSFVLLATALAAALPAGLSAQQITPDIPYTTGLDGPELADMYQPAGAGPFPAIVYIHGGSWRSGNKSDFRKLATDLARAGYAGFSINYDLHPHSFPLSWEEAEAAVRFVRKHAVEYRIDPNRIMIAGASAGGEIAALIALAPQGPSVPAAASAPDATPDNVSAALVLNGAFDLHSSAHVVTRYLNGKCRALPAACQDASPVQHVQPGDPPFFVGHGTSDWTVPYSSAQAFVEALHQARVPVTLYTAAGGHHSYWTTKHFYASNLAAMEGFLTTTLHPVSAAN